MLTFVFLMFIGLFAIAGIFISIEAKKRNERESSSAVSPSDDKPAMGRAISSRD